MIFPEEILKHKKFVSSNLIFDYTDRHDITVIDFLPIGPGIHKSLELRYHHVIKKHPDINYVLMCGQNNDTSPFSTITPNWAGIPNLINWDDPFYMGKFFRELVTRNQAKYVIGFADCAGAYSAVYASKHTPFNSLIMTTPVIGLIPTEERYIRSFENRLDVSSFNSEVGFISGLEYRCKIFEDGKKYENHFDGFPVFLDLVKSGVRIELHWATNVEGIDLFERDRISQINAVNLNMHLHDMPVDEHSHLLNKFLYQQGKTTKLLRDEIELGKIFISMKEENHGK